MSEITITNLNNIISDFKRKLEIAREENSILKNKIKDLEKELKERRR